MSKLVKTANNAEDILQKLWSLCKSEVQCDVIILAGVDRIKIPAHRNILCAVSDYFKGMFLTRNETQSKEVQMCSVNGMALQNIIKYIYTGCIRLTEENVVELLKIADMLLLSKLAMDCADFMQEKLSPSNCFRLAHLAQLYRCQKLLEEANSYCLEYFMKVCDTDEFLKLSVRQLSAILANDDLFVSPEESVFNKLIKWIEHEQTEREQYKAKLLKLVRLPLLDRDFLINIVKPLYESAGCKQIYIDAIELPDSNIKYRKNFTHMLALTQNYGKKVMYIQYYCPQRFKWMNCLLPMKFRTDYGVALMKENLFIVGGRDDLGSELKTVVCLNLKTMALSDISPMHSKRWACSAVVLKGVLYALGGHNISSVEKWNPETNTWSQVAAMSADRSSFGVGVLNDRIYVIGGYTKGCTMGTAEYYDLEHNEWKSIRPLNNGRGFPGVAVTNGVLYVVGGLANQTVERYDPQIDNWILLQSLSEQLHKWSSCTSFRNKVVVCYRDRIEEYNAEQNHWVATKTLNSVGNVFPLFSYTGKLLISKFTENEINLCSN